MFHGNPAEVYVDRGCVDRGERQSARPGWRHHLIAAHGSHQPNQKSDAEHSPPHDLATPAFVAAPSLLPPVRPSVGALQYPPGWRPPGPASRRVIPEDCVAGSPSLGRMPPSLRC